MCMRATLQEICDFSKHRLEIIGSFFAASDDFLYLISLKERYVMLMSPVGNTNLSTILQVFRTVTSNGISLSATSHMPDVAVLRPSSQFDV